LFHARFQGEDGPSADGLASIFKRIISKKGNFLPDFPVFKEQVAFNWRFFYNKLGVLFR